MNRPLVVSVFGSLILTMWLLAWSVVGSAERSPELLTGELAGQPSAPSPEAAPTQKSNEEVRPER